MFVPFSIIFVLTAANSYSMDKLESSFNVNRAYFRLLKTDFIKGCGKASEVGIQQIKTQEKVFSLVEQMPQFPGGLSAMNQFIKEKLVYPKTQPLLSGEVLASFVVNLDRSIQDISIIEGMRLDYSEEAIRIIKLMPKWKPGRQSGREVRVRFKLAIQFK